MLKGCGKLDSGLTAMYAYIKCVHCLQLSYTSNISRKTKKLPQQEEDEERMIKEIESSEQRGRSKGKEQKYRLEKTGR